MAATVPEYEEGAARAALRYSNVAIFLHWAIAALIFYNLTSGLLKSLLPRGFFAFHVSAGITILVLTVLRAAWRLTHRAPGYLPMAGWERGLAHVVHWLLYFAMLAVPFTGWAIVSAVPPQGSAGAAWALEHQARPPIPTLKHETGSSSGPEIAGKSGGQPPRPRGPAMVWGLFKLPLINPINELGRTAAGVPGQRALHDRIDSVHTFGGWMMLGLLILHVAGALKHQFIDRERELARMGIGRPRLARLS